MDSEVQQQTAQDALERLLGPRSVEITLKVDPSLTTSEYIDAFLVRFFFKMHQAGQLSFRFIEILVVLQVSFDAVSGLITITGTTGVAALYGVNDYLQNDCSGLIVWEGSQLNLPNSLPRVTYEKTILDR